MTSDAPQTAEPLNSAPPVSLDLERWAMELEEFVRDISGELSDIVAGLTDPESRPPTVQEPVVAKATAEPETSQEVSEPVVEPQPVPVSPPATPNFANVTPGPESQPPASAPPARPIEAKIQVETKKTSGNDDTATSGSSRLQSLKERLEAVRLSEPEPRDHE